MKKIIAAICAVVLLISSVSVSALALTKEDADSAVVAQKNLFDEAFGQNITAADARNVLLTSAGLKSDVATKLFDIDSDGKITAIDARTFLRIAAKLENINDHYDSIKYDYFCAIINSVKPSGSKFYESALEEIEKVSYVDYNDVVGQMNKQIAYYEEAEKEFEGANYGTFKRAVADVVCDELKDFQDRYNYFINSGEVDKVLAEGAQAAKAVADATLKRVKDAVGLL